MKGLAFSKSAVLKDSTRSCIRNLTRYSPPPITRRFPKARSAAVLVALFVGRMGDLYVLLSRRSTTLKTYAGDTSLPGGKWDDQEDKTLEDTARREAFEEIGLPRDEAKVPLLCTLEPFLAKNMLIVTPVVVLVTDPTLEPVLNGPEVESLFSHPLYSFLTTRPPFTSDAISPEAPNASYDKEAAPYYSYTDSELAGSPIRLHRFLTGREDEGIKPVFGLTSAILIRVAQIGYRKHPSFPVKAPGQRTQMERIGAAMQLDGPLKKAALEEGLGEWYHNEGSTKPKL